MRIIALGGPAGTGKSTIARWICAREEISWLDLDRVAWGCYAPGERAYGKLVARFGGAILDSNSGIDRRKLASAAFASPEAQADLNRIIHPEVERALRTEIARHRRLGTHVLLVEGALLGVSPHIDYRMFDRVLWLEAPLSVRRRRLDRAGRGEHATRIGDEQEFAAPVTRVDAAGAPDEAARYVLEAIRDLLPDDGGSR